LLRMRTRRGGAPAPKGQRCECSSYRCETAFFAPFISEHATILSGQARDKKHRESTQKRERRFCILIEQEGRRCEKLHFLRHLYIKTNILPRQARDNHRENSKKSGVLSKSATTPRTHSTAGSSLRQVRREPTPIKLSTTVSCR
jgi:hypothetical protein